MDVASTPASPRRYDNSTREAQARQTRARIIQAARARFVDSGYAMTSLSQVARDAQVSLPTVQKTFGTKAALVKAVYDVTLAGDDRPDPMASRPEFTELEAETDPRRTLHLFAEIARELWGRLGGLYPAILGGAMSGEPDLVELRAIIASETRVGATDLVAQLHRNHGLRPGLAVDDAVDIVWWLIQPEQYVIHVNQANLTLDRFITWFEVTASYLLIGEHAASTSAP